MAFDPVDYVPPPAQPPQPNSPRLSPVGERIMLMLIAVLMVVLFVLPFSAATFVDIVRYLGD